nr:hypothetical protein [Tanacetum cinerariifolium]
MLRLLWWKKIGRWVPGRDGYQVEHAFNKLWEMGTRCRQLPLLKMTTKYPAISGLGQSVFGPIVVRGFSVNLDASPVQVNAFLGVLKKYKKTHAITNVGFSANKAQTSSHVTQKKIRLLNNTKLGNKKNRLSGDTCFQQNLGNRNPMSPNTHSEDDSPGSQYVHRCILAHSARTSFACSWSTYSDVSSIYVDIGDYDCSCQY